jgi:hypothetical protein
MATIRIIQANDEELSMLTEEALRSGVGLNRMISVRNEHAALTSLREFLIIKMKVDEAQVRLHSC